MDDTGGYIILGPAYNEFGYNEQISLHQNNSLKYY